jgi:hypothetical protein
MILRVATGRILRDCGKTFYFLPNQISFKNSSCKGKKKETLGSLGFKLFYSDSRRLAIQVPCDLAKLDLKVEFLTPGLRKEKGFQ